MKYTVQLMRTYYSHLDVEVEADTEEKAEMFVMMMVDDHDVEFGGIDMAGETDIVGVYKGEE